MNSTYSTQQFRPHFFALHELVPPKIFAEFREVAWTFLDPKLLQTLDNLRMRYGPITVNDYFWGGTRRFSGLRTPGDPHFSPFSQHSFGRAADCIFHEIGTDAVRQDILNHPHDEEFHLISAIELDVSWLHFDVRNCDRILTFSPSSS